MYAVHILTFYIIYFDYFIQDRRLKLSTSLDFLVQTLKINKVGRLMVVLHLPPLVRDGGDEDGRGEEWGSTHGVRTYISGVRV